MRAGPAPSGGEATVEGIGEALGRSQGGFSTKLHLHRASHSDPQRSAAAARLRQGCVPRGNRVERLIGRLKQYRRIATRYEKRAANDLAMVTLGMTMPWLT